MYKIDCTAVLLQVWSGDKPDSGPPGLRTGSKTRTPAVRDRCCSVKCMTEGAGAGADRRLGLPRPAGVQAVRGGGLPGRGVNACILCTTGLAQVGEIMASEARILLLYSTQDEAGTILGNAARAGLNSSQYLWLVTQSVVGDPSQKMGKVDCSESISDAGKMHLTGYGQFPCWDAGGPLHAKPLLPQQQGAQGGHPGQY